MPSAPLLWRPVSSPCMHAGVLVGPGRERWGSNRRTRTRLTGQDAGPYNPRRCRGPKEDEAAARSRRPSRSGPERGARAAAGLRPLPGPFLPEHCPSFTTRAAQRGHQIPLFILDTLSPLDTLFYYFCSIKASPRPDATPTVSVVCSSRHNTHIHTYIYIWWMKLSFSLLVLAWRLRSLLPDGSRLKKLCVGWVGSPAMQRALRVRRVLYMSWREGRETPTIFSAALTIRWRDLRQDALQAPYHTVMQLVRMLSMVPL